MVDHNGKPIWCVECVAFSRTMPLFTLFCFVFLNAVFWLAAQRTAAPIRSSLFLQLLLTFSLYFIPIFFIPSILVFIYKGASLGCECNAMKCNTRRHSSSGRGMGGVAR